MSKVRALGLLASVVSLLSGGSNALAQQVAGGMGEQIQIGAFNARGEPAYGGRNPAGKPSAKAGRARAPEMPETHARHAKPTLPGKHLR